MEAKDEVKLLMDALRAAKKAYAVSGTPERRIIVEAIKDEIDAFIDAQTND